MITLSLVGCVSPIVATETLSLTSQNLNLQILTETNFVFTIGIPYEYQLESSIPADWYLMDGELPNGLQLKNDGKLSGTVKTNQKGYFTVEARKDLSAVSKTFGFTVLDSIWIYPSEITIDNFYPGARAEFTIKIHNDDSVVTEQKTVTTDETDLIDASGFVSVDIPVNQALSNGDIKNVTSMVSSLTSDTLSVVSYDSEKHWLKVSGFVPVTKRVITINYISDATFMVYSENGNWMVDTSNMVDIKEKTFELTPNSTKEVEISIEMPKDYVPSVKQFTFCVKSGKFIKYKSDIQTNIELEVICTVNMK
jgi:hypothetical protein